jgi:tRNA threonylcarbamoyladenosine biosynthesis protein TsaB
MSLIDRAMDISGLNTVELDGFAVTIGPGSFTGLRIGISTIKGLAFASGKPVVGVSSLDALAFRFSDCERLILALLDARKHEVYGSMYRFQKGALIKEGGHWVLPPEKAVEGIDEPCLCIGDGAVLYRETIEKSLGKHARFAPPFTGQIRAGTVGWLAKEKFEKNETDDVALLVPCYIRKSDAQIHQTKKTTGEST